MKNRKTKNVVGVIAIIIIVLASFLFLASNVDLSVLPSYIQSEIKELKGELIGNKYVIDYYDNFGNNILTVNGQKISMNANYKRQKVVDSDGNVSEAYVETSVISITIDGHNMGQTGNTVIFAEEGLEKLEDFEMPTELNGNGGGTVNAVDRKLNHFENLIGKPQIVAVCTQQGTPIAVYGGKKVYEEICEDLPKTTLFNIDGKLLYIHRANMIFFDGELMKFEEN